MDEEKRIGFRITFPNPSLTPDQEQALEEAFKSTVAAVLMGRIRGQTKVIRVHNDIEDDRVPG
jgi:hypothetical protein